MKSISSLITAGAIALGLASPAFASAYKFNDIGSFTANGSMTVTSIAISIPCKTKLTGVSDGSGATINRRHLYRRDLHRGFAQRLAMDPPCGRAPFTDYPERYRQGGHPRNLRSRRIEVAARQDRQDHRQRRQSAEFTGGYALLRHRDAEYVTATADNSQALTLTAADREVGGHRRFEIRARPVPRVARGGNRPDKGHVKA